MESELFIRAAAQPADTERLRELASQGGPARVRTLASHLAQPRYRPTLTRMAGRAGALVGAALIGHRRLRLGAATLEVGAVELLAGPDDASASPALQEGLLADCLGVLIDEGLPLVMLRGAAERYAVLGLAPDRLRGTVELAATPGVAGAPLREAVPGDLDDLAALYAASYAELALAEDRAAPDWRAWLSDHDVLVLEDGRGRVVAYAALSEGGLPSALGLAEAAAADAGAARQLCAALVARARADGQADVLFRLAPWHPVAQAAIHLGGSARLSGPAADEPAELAGVVDLPGALAQLAPELERRLAGSRYAGWDGNLRLELASERATLAFERGRAAVIDGQRPADLRLRQIELPALAQLYLGFRSAADLRATGGLDCEDSALGLIDALFPAVLAVE
jgi:hypothetical protein